MLNQDVPAKSIQTPRIISAPAESNGSFLSRPALESKLAYFFNRIDPPELKLAAFMNLCLKFDYRLIKTYAATGESARALKELYACGEFISATSQVLQISVESARNLKQFGWQRLFHAKWLELSADEHIKQQFLQAAGLENWRQHSKFTFTSIFPPDEKRLQAPQAFDRLMALFSELKEQKVREVVFKRLCLGMDKINTWRSCGLSQKQETEYFNSAFKIKGFVEKLAFLTDTYIPPEILHNQICFDRRELPGFINGGRILLKVVEQDLKKYKELLRFCLGANL